MEKHTFKQPGVKLLPFVYVFEGYSEISLPHKPQTKKITICWR